MSMCTDQQERSLIVLDVKEANSRVPGVYKRSGYSLQTIDLNGLESEQTVSPLEIIDTKQVKRQSELLGIPEMVLLAFNGAMKNEEKAPTMDNFVNWMMKLYVER
ncbi:hypothetical protein [Enterococcus raffinosus]|uniref:hypothetical protein n=1 Tax=Enterococcus raffinosus TaxID=71452 RepID=UPI003ACC3865